MDVGGEGEDNSDCKFVAKSSGKRRSSGGGALREFILFP